MVLKVSPASIETAGQELAQSIHAIYQTTQSANQTVLNGAFSSIDGLSRLAISHGGVLHGGIGSAYDCLTTYQSLLEWAQSNFYFNCRLFTGQDLANKIALERADSGGASVSESVGSTSQPVGTFGDFSFPMAVASKPVSVDFLAAELAGTNSEQAAAAAATWESLSAQAIDIAGKLRSVVATVGANNEGLWVPIATGMISQFASNAEFFAGSAQEMARATTTLAGIAPSFLPVVHGAQAGLAAVVEPVERRLAEEAFLTEFQAALNAVLPCAMPSIRNLMQESVVTGSVQSGQVGNYSANAGSQPVPPVLGPTVDALGRAVQDISAGRFGSLEQAAAQVGQIGTEQLASMAANGAVGGNAGSGFAPAVHSPGAIAPSATSAAVGGLANAATSVSAAGANTIAGVVRGANSGTSHVGNGATGFTTGISPNASTGVGMGHGAGAGGLGAGPGMGGMVGANPLTANPKGSSLGVQTPVGGRTGGNVVAPVQAVHSERMGAGRGMAGPVAGPFAGGMPMNAANSGKQESRRRRQVGHKVQSLTAQFERELNTRELLGEFPKVVPGVIGAWVRDPYRKSMPL